MTRSKYWASALALALLSTTTGAARAEATAVSPAGPLTRIDISPDLNCAVNHTGDTSGEFFSGTACATLIAVNDTLYGPASIPAGGAAAPRTTFTPVSQTPWTGTGTSADPYRIVTVVDLGTTGLQLTETDTYRQGEEAYQTDVRLANSSSDPVNAVVYRAGDCFLQNDDAGYGLVGSPAGAIACTTADRTTDPNAGGRIEQWLPITAGSNYLQASFSEVWAAIGTQDPFADTCRCTEQIDNGAGLSWSIAAPAGGSSLVSSLITFSPLGNLPLTTTKTADTANVTAGGTDGYTITVANPNTTTVTLASITDTLPAGFTYTTGSTTPAALGDPTINGQTLTWNGPVNIPAQGTTQLHFNVHASATAGTYQNNATATANDGYTVAPTGDTAPITVTAPAHQPLTTTKTADTANVTAGGTDGYTITVANPNTTTVTLASITDTLPAGFTYTTGSTTPAALGDPTINGQTLTWNGPVNIPAQGTTQLHFNVHASATAGTYQNNATATANDGYTVAPTGDTAPITVTAPAHQPLTTTKTADTANVTAGGTDGYTITVANPNTTTVTLASITDTLPAGFTYTTGSTTPAALGDPTINGQTLTWNGPVNIPAQGTTQLHFNVHTCTAPGTYRNNATANATDGYTVAPTGDTAPITVTAPAHQPLTTTKTADTANVTAGGTDGYTITVANPNTTTVTLASITDTLPAGFTYTTGSTTPAALGDPTINGQTLTWNGPVNIPAQGTTQLHFNVHTGSCQPV